MQPTVSDSALHAANTAYPETQWFFQQGPYKVSVLAAKIDSAIRSNTHNQDLLHGLNACLATLKTTALCKRLP
tara:strand:+ start:2643 stop:2861 length:219 start_codon:yes stop_codon:yes gene_type:complete